ncbi:uncharacterized protein LOC130445880 [Diorhabda sublineata]|uniref:uncharacterized protein LOC130445880 n=1 Tax=Diorhabda sublineata TaxID=1163346 RepID=UPI0024E18204|nr:uncharacterized protein LOC130445880 [Diorhabda sublineata]
MTGITPKDLMITERNYIPDNTEDEQKKRKRTASEKPFKTWLISLIYHIYIAFIHDFIESFINNESRQLFIHLHSEELFNIENKRHDETEQKREEEGNPVVNINDNVDQKSNAEDGSLFVNTDNRQASENTFYPAFSPFQNQPLGHSRPIFFTQQDTAFSQRTPFQNNFDNSGRHSGYKDSYIFNNNNASPKPEQESILGSGNFGVITGGTFYSEKDENSKYGNYDSFSHNGHGKPAFYFTSQSKPQPYQQEQFANFKDFADINTQNDRQYSQYVVAYAPRENDTIERENRGEETVVTKPIPKNIIESLTLIDSEHITTIPEKKLSASKRKLALLKPEKKHLIKIIKKTKSRELEEPLLALS